MASLVVALFFLAVTVAVSAVGFQAPPSCAPAGRVQFVCGLEAPEDLVVLPGDRWIVASAYSGRGGIYLIDATRRSTVFAYPGQKALEKFDARTYTTCPGPPDAAARAKFRTHGLSLVRGADSVHRLFAVLHGSRESVEVFEVDARPATPTITWIGCAVAPGQIGLNSVRGRPGGGFVATNFLARSGGPDIKAVMAGQRNGELWDWETASGWQKVDGTEIAGANGVETSEDGRSLFVSAWGGQAVAVIRRGSAGTRRDDVPLGFRADNIRWARNRIPSLLVAGQDDNRSASVVVTIDTATLSAREILRHPDSAEFGAATVAVEVGQELWVGSFRGDRVAIFPRPE